MGGQCSLSTALGARRSLPLGGARQSQFDVATCAHAYGRAPHYRKVAANRPQGNQAVRFEEVPYSRAEGARSRPRSTLRWTDITALVIQQPNSLVCSEMSTRSPWARERGIFVIAAVNPTSLAVLKTTRRVGPGRR